DSRTLEKGNLFVALEGETYDGHHYLPQAFEKGAAAVLVSQFLEIEGPFLQVSDVQRALIALGQGGRNRASRAQIIGITGSVGKTGTKEALRHILSMKGLTHANVASFNNHWGTPLSLGRMPRDTAFGVFEMGMNHPGEIRNLTHQIRPDVAIITLIGEAHKGAFSSLEGIAAAKAEIFEGMVPKGIAVLNHDDPFFDFLKRRAFEENLSIVSFGAHREASVRLIKADLHPEFSDLTILWEGASFQERLNLPGRHWVSNALGILGVLLALGLKPAGQLDRLKSLLPLSGRGQQLLVPFKKGEIKILDESYNANPTSMKAALRLLGQQKPLGRRVAILGDMLELGATETEDHKSLRQELQEEEIDVVFCCGPLMKHLYEALPPLKRGGWGLDAQELFPLLEKHIEAGDVLMIKGSKKMKLDRIIETLVSSQKPNRSFNV
ncbi:MAG: UDP-N-acetylmuramoyl-tripeptide--D-alanyl-D-alanine ligase, partial [Holosporales bacterium]|nr:UDP-N-acetylmuramoyl-tripeptide--D-alanyl-D-alanine ligase [Holosporales bacterium]